MEANAMKSVFTIVERDGNKFWVKLGVGFVNRDGSLNLKLDALPANGTMHVRDYEARQEGVVRRSNDALREEAAVA